MKKCVLVVGHSRDSQGAENSYSGISEYNYNSMLAVEVQRSCKEVEVVIIYRESTSDGYSNLIASINKESPDFVISLHCNAFNASSTGCETLYWHSSEKGQKIAEIIQHRVRFAMQNRNRGIKPKRKGDRGAILLCNTKAPCVILEPFFIDNVEELRVALQNYKTLSLAIVDSIEDIAESIS